MQIIKWGILGPGRISRTFMAGLLAADGAEVVAVGSRDLNRAKDFAAEFSVPQAYGSYKDLVDDTNIDAIYIGTPHSHHAQHTLLCLNAGKHVLCEKSLALNAAQAERMISTARAHKLALMEAVWTRFLPAIVKVRELIAAGAIGEVRMIQADFGFRADFDEASRLFNPELGGGALLDLGIYPLNLAFMICGEPTEIHTTANVGSTGVDEESAVVLRHAGGQISVLSSSLRADTPREAHIIGTNGRITICFPWWSASRIVLHPAGGPDEEFAYDNRGRGYSYEAEAFMDMIRTGSLDSPVMPLAESLAILKTMDTLRARWGVKYPGDKIEGSDE